MKIIRDEECFGLAMMPLFCDWNIKRCNWQDCTRRPNTIVITDHQEEALHFGLCEEHYQAGNVPGGVTMPLEFNDFDAFSRKESDNGE